MSFALPHAAVATRGGTSAASSVRTSRQDGRFVQQERHAQRNLLVPVLAFRVLADCVLEEDEGLERGGFVYEAASIFRLVEQMATLYAGLPSFPELFRPAFELLQRHPDGALPMAGVFVTMRARCLAHLEAAVLSAEALRQPVRLHRQVSAPIKQFHPAFEVDFQPDRSLDPDRERAAKQLLAHKVKKEQRGAVRELRKDAAFLAIERRKEQKASSDYLDARGKRALQILEEQEATWKNLKKEESRFPVARRPNSK